MERPGLSAAAVEGRALGLMEARHCLHTPDELRAMRDTAAVTVGYGPASEGMMARFDALIECREEACRLTR